MARRYVFICDGCETRHEQKQQTLPTAWSDVSIVVDGFTNWAAGSGKNFEAGRLLCGQCQIRLREVVDPRDWPRGEATS